MRDSLGAPVQGGFPELYVAQAELECRTEAAAFSLDVVRRGSLYPSLHVLVFVCALGVHLI